MTMTPTLPPPDVLDRMSTEQRRTLAEQIWRESLAAGRPIPASELGPMVGRSASWGRTIVRQIRSSADSPTTEWQAPDSPRQPQQPPADSPATERLLAGEPPAAGGVNGQQPGGPERQAPDSPRLPQQPPAEQPVAVAATGGSRRHVEQQPPRQVDERPNSGRQPGRAERRVTTAAVVVVALVAAVASFDHQRLLAEAAGEGWRSWLLPLSVDGLILSASMTMRARRRAGQPAGALAWVSLLAGVAASLAANIAAAEPTIVGRLVAGWPPLALLLAHELLHRHQAAAGGRRPAR